MRARADSLSARFLPQGWIDLLRQIGLFCGAYYLYGVVRGIVDGRADAAYANARELIHIERSLDLFIEPAVHAWASGSSVVIDTASWMYVNSHFTITTITLAFIYLFRNERFYFMRNMFMIAMGIALVGYVVFPTAPPRLMPEWGFSDSVADLTGVEPDSATSNLLFNPFAAVPSMHVAFSLMLGLSMASMTRRGWAKALWRIYPPVVTFVVIATANHWWFDAFAGALTAGVAALCTAGVFARARPQVWAWNPQAGAAA